MDTAAAVHLRCRVWVISDHGRSLPLLGTEYIGEMDIGSVRLAARGTKDADDGSFDTRTNAVKIIQADVPPQNNECFISLPEVTVSVIDPLLVQ